MEAFQFQSNNAMDSELVYTVRSLISEGRVRYPTVEKDENANLITREKVIEGPTSFITTTILETLEAQLEDRLFTIHPDESFEQTKNIIQKIGETKAGKVPLLDKKVISAWKLFHKSLKPVEVVIPYAEKISRFIIQREDIPIATRRAFNRVMVVIQAITCFYQMQRSKDEQGRVISEVCDYWMALQIVHEAFKETMGDQSRNTEGRLQVVKEAVMIKPKDLAKKLGLSGSSVSQWSNKKVQEGVLAWCDSSGEIFGDERDLKKAKHNGEAYLRIANDYDPVNVAGLPSPFALTSDPKWEREGELLVKYDLELKVKPQDNKMCLGVKEVFSPAINTPEDNEPVNNIQNSDDEGRGVKVFSQFDREDNDNFAEEGEIPAESHASEGEHCFMLKRVRAFSVDDITF